MMFMDPERAFLLGANAFERWVSMENCPFVYMDLAQAWLSGWWSRAAIERGVYAAQGGLLH